MTSTLGPQTHLKSVTRFPFYWTNLQESHTFPSYVPYTINVSSQAVKMLSKFQTHPKSFTFSSLSIGAFNCARHSSVSCKPTWGFSLSREVRLTLWLFSSVAQSWPTICDPMDFLAITNSQIPPKPMSIESVMPSNHLILRRLLLLLPSIFQYQGLFQ